MFTVTRSDYIRHALEKGLDAWWERHELPSRDLLRDGLILLQNGDELSEGQRALLLRMALTYGKGVLTALRHQTNPERTAVMLSEALLLPESGWSFDDLRRWLSEDSNSAAWSDHLRTELLGANQIASAAHKKRIASLIAVTRNTDTGQLGQLERARSTNGATNGAADGANDDGWIVSEESTTRPVAGSVSYTRFVMAILLLVILGAVFYSRFWPRFDNRAMVEITAFLQPVPLAQPVSPLDAPVQVTEAGERSFLIDQNEVSNSEYRACVAAGACNPPKSSDSATRVDYFLKPEFSKFPVVHVDAESAAAYCGWRGKRLPTAEEWEVAASLAPATGRRYRYPWGDHFEAQFVTSAESGSNDTSEIGTHRPQGVSPLGVGDMAGNVAEWTASTVRAGDTLQRVVKGGSFKDNAEQLQVIAQVTLPGSTAEMWLGFRCAR